jgi:hypothetical protein
VSVLWWLAGTSGCDGRGDDDPPDPDPTATTATTATTGDTSDSTTGLPLATVERLLASLRARDLVASEGAISWSVTDDCCTWGDCYLTNEGSAYGTWALPPSPGEYVADRPFPDDAGRIASWRLRADEATLYVGPPPPGSRYVSFRSYVHDIAAGGARALAFTSLGDSANDQSWNANADGTLLVLTSGHQGTIDLVREAAIEAGWPEVQLDLLPADRVNLGLDQAADGFHVTLRVVGFEDRAAFDAFQVAPTARVFKLRPEAEVPPAPVEALPARLAAAAPPAELTTEVAALRQSIVDAHPGWTVVDGQVTGSEPPLDVPDCWSGCNRDVSYSATGGVLMVPGARLVVYGVDPAALGRATWTEVMLAGAAERDAAGSAGTDDLAGSAAAWSPGANAALYAWTFARDCTGVPFCSVIPYECPGLGPVESGSILWRHYLDPATATWPPLAGLGERGALYLLPPPD